MSSVAGDVDTEPFLDYKGLLVFLKPSKRKKIKKVRVNLNGTLNIHNANEFKTKISEIFSTYDYVDFYLQDIDYLDLPFMQTLYHLKSFFGTREKVVTIDAVFSEEMKKIIIRSGFESLMIKPKNV